MLSWLANAWRVPELRKRVLFTALILALYRLGSWVPAPGVDSSQIQGYFDNKGGGTILGLLSVFSGGALARFSLFALGIMPYVTASIILQLMTVVVPKLEELQKEGESGTAKINQYTRYLTVALAAAQSTGYAYLFQRQGILTHNSGRLVLIIITLTAGTTLLMWMGELITKRGVGNGISLLIFASILDGPLRRDRLVQRRPDGEAVLPADRDRDHRGGRLHPGGPAQDPDPVRQADGRAAPHERRRDLHAAAREHGGRDPDHLRGGLMAFPPTIGQYFPQTQGFVNRHFQPSSLTYLGLEAFLIIVFTYFYTAVQFNPVDQADNLRKYGGYVPGIRPGPPTAQYFDRVLTRLTLPGSIYLATIAVLPSDLHPLRRFLPGELARPRRHVRADRRRSRPRHDAPDGVADDDALLRGLSQIVALNVLLLGPQGAGKGTQGRLLSTEHGIPHIATGDMLRAAIAAGTELGRKAEPLLSAGRLVPDEIMIELIRDRLAEADTSGGFVLDGFPRTSAQAEALDTVLEEIERPLSVVFQFQLPEEVCFERLQRRAEEEGRADDTPEAIRTRLALYHEQTEPLAEYYRARGNLVGVPADRPVDEVFAELQRALEQVAVR